MCPSKGAEALDLSVTGRHVEITESMRRYVEEKLLRLERLYDRIESIQVVVTNPAARFRTEVVVHVDRKQTLVAQVEADAFNESVDLVIDKMERQLHEHKEKLRNRKHQPGDLS
jgi:putative sigma-54 modulation protein